MMAPLIPRTTSEIIVVTVLSIFFYAHNDIIGFLHPLFDCDVHGLPYQCVVPNTKSGYSTINELIELIR